MFRLFAAVIGAAVFVSAVRLGELSSLTIFVSIPSLLFATVMPLFFTLAHHEPRLLLSAISAALQDQTSDPATAQRHQAALSTLRLTITASGVVGSLVGIIDMLTNLEDPSVIGPAMATALLTTLYAVGLSELFVAPLINRIRSATLPAPEAPPAPITVSLFTLIHIPFLLLIFLLLLLCFATFP